MTDQQARWLRISGIFAAALDQPADARARFVAEACADDEVAHSDVLRLLAAHDHGEFLEAPAWVDEGDVEAPGGGAGHVIGRAVGPYVVTHEVGRGQMGILLAAWDTQLERKVALKMLPPDLSHDSERRKRLAREARLAAAVQHPNIASTYALIDAGDDIFVVSEFVEGRNLREVLEAHVRLSNDEALAIALSIARGLEAAHAAGVVLRDLKPENAMVAGSGVVQLGDFGIARAIDGAAGVPTATGRVTIRGVVLGAPGYMWPEQLRGGGGDIRGDLFAFGVVLFELLTGTHPFGGANAASTIARILERPPLEVPSSVNVSAPIRDLVACLLEKDPARRPSSAREVVAVLEGFAAPPAVAPHPARAIDAGRWWFVHQCVVAAIVTAMLYPLWRVRQWDDVRASATLVFFGALVAATLAVSIRLHWCFAARVDREAFRGQRRRTRGVVVAAEVAFAALLGAAAWLAHRHDAALAALLVTVAIALVVASAVIEPFTTRAEFGE